MNATGAQREEMASRVIARLAERERRVFTLRLPELAAGINSEVFTRYATLHLLLPDLAFMRQLAYRDDGKPAVAALFDAWSWGMRCHISLHRQLLPALPAQALCPLPLTLSDHQGHSVEIFSGQVLSYADVAGRPSGWLMVAKSTLITGLARDLLSTRGIQLLRQE